MNDPEALTESKQSQKPDATGNKQLAQLETQLTATEQLRLTYALALALLEGLKGGISQYLRRPTRCAVIYFNTYAEGNDATKNLTNFFVCDPDKILAQHAYEIKQFLEDEWSTSQDKPEIDASPSAPGPNINGLYARAIHDRNTFFQMWFVEIPLHLFSESPLEGWLGLSSAFLDYEPKSASQAVNYGHASAKTIAFGVKQAVASGLWQMSGSKDGRVYDDLTTILEAVNNIAQTAEEGTLPCGQILFTTANSNCELKKSNFTPRAPLSKYKHVSKLLAAVANSTNSCLVSNTKEVFAISRFQSLPRRCLFAKFGRSEGELWFDGQKICTFANGQFYGTDPPSVSDLLSQARLYASLPGEFKRLLSLSLQQIVQHAQSLHHGCSIVLDFGDCPKRWISGHELLESLSLTDDQALAHETWQLLLNTSFIDGAIHIQLRPPAIIVRGFGCILAGDALEDEDRARGARHTSARRFSHSYREAIVIVVSEDGPVSVFEHGNQITPALPELDEMAGGLVTEAQTDVQEDRIETLSHWFEKLL